MFRPEKMSLISIIALREDLDEIMQGLVEAGAVHIEKSKQFISEGVPSIKPVNTQESLNESRSLLGRIEDIIEKMDIPGRKFKLPKKEFKIAPYQVIQEIKADFNQVESEVKDLLLQLDRYKKDLKQKQKLSWLIPLLKEEGVDISTIPNYKYITLHCGILPFSKLTPLKDSLRNITYQLKFSRYLKGNMMVCLATSTDYIKTVERVLKGINFEPISLSSVIEDFSKGKKQYELDNLAEDIEYKLWEDREGIADVKKEIGNLKDKFSQKLIIWKAKLKININVLKSMQNFVESRYGYCISGWVPYNKVSLLKRKLYKVCEGRLKIGVSSAEELKNLDVKVPTKFNNPIMFRPFEKLVTTYGVPDYNNIDPTIFVALSFVGMFGMMFGDVGHGAVLTLLGLIPFLFNKLNTLREFGVILSSCGISSVIFGFLFGSIFGLENVLPTLWFKPLKQPVYFLKIGIFIGIGMITLGIVLSIIQNIIKKNFKQTFFGQWGVFSSIFYWLCLGLGWKIMATGSINISLPIIWFILLIPLLMITFGDIIVTKFKKDEKIDLAESIFKPIELMLGILTNTVSFVRVAAFGLTHAALMMTLFIIVGFLGEGLPGLKESILVEGNIGIIILEGLIVFIQTLRLEYYEFFSKFFVAEGRLFRPLSNEGTT